MPPTPLPLKDIHLPEAISWWPPAIGWWILAFLITTFIVFGYWLYKRATRITSLKTAKKLLAELQQNDQLDNSQKLAELSVLLRRFAISIYPRAQVAGLTGKAWLKFLDSNLPDTPFSEGVGRSLADAPYRKSPPSELELSQLFSLCTDWLNLHTKQK